MQQQSYQNWHLTTDGHNILWLTLDRADASVNSLNRSVLEELEHILDILHKASDKPEAIIFKSGKTSGFIPGADIQQFVELGDVNEAFTLVRKGQQIFDKIENLTIPSVAMIDGFCLGGGTELALACTYRVAEDGPKTRIGLPEVLLGIHPGWGGSVRLPRLIGATAALEFMLTGRVIPAKVAAKMGIVDAAVPKRQLERAARFYALEQPTGRKLSWFNRLAATALARPLIGYMLRRVVETRETPKTPLQQLKLLFDTRLPKKITPEQYPAPFAMINNWVETGGGKAREKDYIKEAQSVGKLLLTDTSKNLVRVFFLQERLKGLAKNVNFAPKHVHVIGAGTMGGDIAAWCALRGMTVTLQDREAKLLSPALERANKLFKSKLRAPRDVQAAMDRLIPDVAGYGIAKADVIIEAIFENLQAKQTLFAELEKRAKPDAILATNTSSIPLDEISTALQDPSRLVGIHFFNPVAKMQLVEVVQSAKTNPEVVARAIAFVRKIDRLPLPVKSSPGFLVNRVLMPYLMECMQLVEEGVPLAAIDRAAEEFGMPMGPVELADTVGLDICLSVAKNLTSHFGGTIPSYLQSMVDAGKLGRKTGEGFYKYKHGKPIKPAMPKSGIDTQALAERMIGKMLIEAQKCLQEGVVADADLLDVGMIFGTGFAPFRGGPMHYLKDKQIAKATQNTRPATEEATA
jgi:3-hydroxyacyl-CoA dehydrogenase/enoyl-CoA hydratase/3-hydroxybutyryl-CoA epimerase